MDDVHRAGKPVTVARRAPFLRSGTLDNGLEVAVRRIVPEDREAFEHGFEALSEQARYQRFLAGTSRLTAHQLGALVDAVDQGDHVGLLLVWPRTSQDDVLLGEGRFIRWSSRPEAAEVAVTIADEAQGHGAARFVMRVLADLALERGITRFTARMASANEAAARMLLGVGTLVRDDHEGSEREVEVTLAPAG